MCGLFSGVVDITAALAVALAGMAASRSLFHTFVQSLMRAPLVFYERTPLGRVLSRVSGDLAVIDYVMPFTMRSMVNCSLGLVSCVGVLAYTTPLILTLLPPLFVLYYFIQVTAPPATGTKLYICTHTCMPAVTRMLHCQDARNTSHTSHLRQSAYISLTALVK